MRHEMKLKEHPFKMMKSGLKTIELRLYDEKRRAVQIGDTICFHRYDNDEEKIEVVVKNLYVFPSFKVLYEELPLIKCGYSKEDVINATYLDMTQYYTLEEQNKYGVIGIEVVLC